MEKQKEFDLDDLVRGNTFDKDISIVGYITPRTIEKWGFNVNGFSKTDNVYVGVRKDKSLCYLLGLGIPQPVDYSRFYR